MRRCTFFTILLGTLCLVTTTNVFSQAAKPDSSSQQNALNNTLMLFYASIGKQSPLFNGPEYYFYDPIIKGNAYYNDVNAFTPGSVNYDGTLFKGVPMLYDTYADQVVALLYNHFTKFSLVKDKVTSFDFLEHHFVNIDTLTLAPNSAIRPGYHDELYKGKLQILVQRSKNIQTTPGNNITGPNLYFNSFAKYFLRKNNIYFSFSGQSSLLHLLKDKRKELQQYIRGNQVKFHDNPEEAMVKIASYYDHLTN